MVDEVLAGRRVKAEGRVPLQGVQIGQEGRQGLAHVAQAAKIGGAVAGVREIAVQAVKISPVDLGAAVVTAEEASTVLRLDNEAGEMIGIPAMRTADAFAPVAAEIIRHLDKWPLIDGRDVLDQIWKTLRIISRERDVLELVVGQARPIAFRRRCLGSGSVFRHCIPIQGGEFRPEVAENARLQAGA